MSVGLDKVVVVSTDLSRRQADGSSIPCPLRCRLMASGLAQEAIPAVSGDNGAGDESGVVMKISLRVVQRRQNHYDVVLVRVAWMPECHGACHIVGNVLSAILMCRSSKRWP